MSTQLLEILIFFKTNLLNIIKLLKLLNGHGEEILLSNLVFLKNIFY
jgi:hypothetical protein